MSKITNTIFAIMLVGAFPALSAYTWSNTPHYTQENAVTLAMQFLHNMPTYAFDGMADTVQVINVEPLRMLNTWEVTIEFTSSHGGYGDRTGQMVTMALTTHHTKIVVSTGQIIRATTDEVYDEVNGTMIPHDDTNQEDAQAIMLEFLKNAPTFAFDGITESIKIIDVAVAESYPVQYIFTVTFDCRNAGYGDRTGMMLAQVITPHEATIIVSDGQVKSAILDNKWDELKQGQIEDDSFLTPEAARDSIIGYILTTYPQLSRVQLPDQWFFEDLTPEGLLGSSTFCYSGMGWTITVKFNIVLEPVYTVNVKYDGDEEFTWEGTVDQSLTISETSTSLEPLTTIVTVEYARDLVIKYARENLKELKDATIPTEWVSEDLTPQDILGYSKTRFTSGDWTVDVAGPVVWHPTYSVDIVYNGEPSFTWSCTVQPTGEIII